MRILSCQRRGETKLKDAIKILIEHAANDFKGAGLGIRSLPSYKQREIAIEAFKVAWKYAYGWEISDNEKFNLGIDGLQKGGVR